MSEYFVFGGISSLDYNVLLLADDTEGTSYEYETIAVAGRSGDLHRGKKRYKNKDRKIVVYTATNGEQRISELNAALLAVTDYQRLQSTIHPDWYMMGQYDGNIKPKKSAGYIAARVELTFDCKPQKYLVSGDTEVTLTDGGTITNPTLYPAKPILYVTGDGSFSIGRYTIQVLEDLDDLVIDCDMETAYSSEDGTNYNDKIRVFDNDFLSIVSGENAVEIDSGMTVTVLPRWWTL